MDQTYCRYCSYAIRSTDFFCSNCGKKLREKPASLSFLSLAWLLILSAVLPPLGVGVTIKYIRDENLTAKVLGWVSLIITAVMIVVMTNWALAAFAEINQQINSQLENYMLYSIQK